MSEKPDAPSTGTDSPSLFSRWRDRDHTRGSLLTSLVVLALPLVATSLFGGVLFQLIDLKLISGLGDQAVTAVVVTNQSLRQFFFMLVMGASFGTQGLISRSIGERNFEQADHVAGQTVLMGLILSFFLAVLGLTFSRELLGVMNVSSEVLAIGIPYVRLVLLLNFGFIFVNIFNAILNGAGDTATPFLIAVVQTLLALLGEWCLIYGNLGMPALGISGVALGMGVGQIGAIVLISRVLFGGGSRVHVRKRHMRPDPKVMKSVLVLAWPPALQMLGTFVVTVFFIRLMGEFGDKAQTAYSIGLRMGMLAPMICFPLAGAVATLVGQALGSGSVERAWRAIRVGLTVICALMWSLAVVLYFFRENLLQIFTQDPEVIAIGSRMLTWQAASLVPLAFSFVFFRALQGAGDMLVPMLISVLNAVLLTLPLGIYLSESRGMGPEGLFIAQFASALIGTTLTGAWVLTGRWTNAISP